jgi:hypothetical protein
MEESQKVDKQIIWADWLISKGFTMRETAYIISHTMIIGDLGKAILDCICLRDQIDQDFGNPITP